MEIKNINGTSEKTCECGSWINHWEKFSGEELPSKCPVIGCNNKPEVGAHVQKDEKNDNNWYIIPLCKNCNNKKGETLQVENNIKLVSANVSKTCGKSSRK